MNKERRVSVYSSAVIWLLFLAISTEMSVSAQSNTDCDSDPNSCEPTELPPATQAPPLVIPDLIPVPETEQPLYIENLIIAPDGNDTRLVHLSNSELFESDQAIPDTEILLPLRNEFLPQTQRGYFTGHRAWDITYGLAPYGQEIFVQPPHPEAILIAGFEDIPLGAVAERLQTSGAVEVFYLNIQTDDDSTHPYLITYAHLEPATVSQALHEAEANQGRVEIAGTIGNTGLTDGRHIHMQTIDLNYLYELIGTNDPLEAYGYLTNLENPITEDMNSQIFINPADVIPRIRQIDNT